MQKISLFWVWGCWWYNHLCLAEYARPCTKGSLASGDYALDVSGYFCTEPVRTLYAEGSIYSGVNVSTYTLYHYPIHNTSATDYIPPDQTYAHVQTQPCNCYGQKVQWKSEKLPFTSSDDNVDAYLKKVQDANVANLVPEWFPFDDGTPCVYTKLGYSWAISSESLPDPLMLTIPPGNTVNVIKTGSNVNTFMNSDADPVPCGVVARDVYQAAFVPMQSVASNAGSNELDFYERAGSMPISDYCAASRIVDNSNWTTLSVTQRVFQATIIRLAGAIETVKQCRMGMPAAIILASGLWPYHDFDLPHSLFGLSTTPSFISLTTHVRTDMKLNAITYTMPNSMLLCTGDSIASAMTQLVADMNVYIQQSTVPSVVSYLQTKTNYSAQQCQVTTTVESIPVPLFSQPVTLNKTTIKVQPGYSEIVTRNLIQYVQSGQNVSLSAVPLFDTTPAGPQSAVYGLVCLDVESQGAKLEYVSDETYITSACWTEYLTKVQTVWQLQVHSPSHSTAPFKSTAFPCNTNQAMHVSTIQNSECQAAYVGGGNWRFVATNPAYGMILEYTCIGYPTYNTVTVASNVPATADLTTDSGRTAFSRQLNFIFAYYYEFSLLVQEPALFAHFLMLVQQSTIRVPTTVQQSDLRSIMLPGEIVLAHGVFQAAATTNLPLALNTTSNTHLFNPFMPNGITTNISMCMPDASRWETPSDVILNIAKPSQLTYFTADQVAVTLGSFFSLESTQSMQGALANVMAFYDQMDFSAVTLPTIPTTANHMLLLPEHLTLEAIVGYQSSTISPPTAFYTALLGSTCTPPSNFFEGAYLASRSQDLSGRPYNHIHMPLYNAILKAHWAPNRSIHTTITVGTPLMCLEYSQTTMPTLAAATNTTCFFQFDTASYQFSGGSDTILQTSSIPPNNCSISADIVFCRCTATTLAPCNVPLILPDIWYFLALASTQPVQPYVPPNNYITYTQTTALGPQDLDTVHCTSKNTSHSRHYLEKPLFLNPEYTSATLPRTIPPGLSQAQLAQWCSRFSITECARNNQSFLSYNLCTLVNNTCVLRTYNYGPLSSLPGIDTIYNVTQTQCHYWNAALDEPWQCQRPNAFTGCVLIETRDVQGNWSIQSALTDHSGTSIRIPNSYERLVMTEPRQRYRYYDQMYMAVFTRNSVSERDYGTCACRYINERGIRTAFTLDVGTNYNVLNMTVYANTIPNIARNPHVYPYLITVPFLGDGITVTIPTAASIKYQPEIVLDYTRTALRCDCADPDLKLAPQAFEIVERTQPRYMFAGHNLSNTFQTAPLGLACVPLNEKEAFIQATGDQTAMTGALQRSRVYRTRPVDCNALAYATGTGLASITTFKEYCLDQSADYEGMCTENRDSIGTLSACLFNSKWYANIGSNIPMLTHWSTAAEASEPLSAYFFATLGSGSVPFASVPSYCATNNNCASAEFAGMQCTATEQTCGIMMDKVYMDACSILAQTSIPMCSKPQLQMVYPDFSAQRPDTLGAFVTFPFDIWKWNGGSAFTVRDGTVEANTVLRNTVQRPVNAYWDEQLTMVHYCDRYFGGFVFCENDALVQQERERLCGPAYNASVVYVGTTLAAFTLADVCPFKFDPSLPRTCFVFPGDTVFGSVGAILQFLPGEVGDITFYYVPFSIKALRLLFLHAAFSDTLVTNTFNAAESEFITDDNVQHISKNAQLLARPILEAIRLHPETGHSQQQAMCNRRIPLDTDTIQFYYDAIMATYNTKTHLFEFVTVDVSLGQQSDNVKALSRTDVFPPIQDVNIRIMLPGITILPAIAPHIHELVFDNSAFIRSRMCTRFIVYAPRFHLANITFNQTACVDAADTHNQIPIVFTGAASAVASSVTNIKTIDAPAAVALYGGTELFGSTALFLQGEDFTTHNITMSYTPAFTTTLSMRNNVAVFGKTVGTVVTDGKELSDLNGCNRLYCDCSPTETCSYLVYNSLTTQSDIAICGDPGFAFSDNTTTSLFLQAWSYDVSAQINFQEKYVWSLDAQHNIIIQAAAEAGIIFTRLALNENVNVMGSTHVYYAKIRDKTLTESSLLTFVSRPAKACIARNTTTQALYATACLDDYGHLRPDITRFFVNTVTSRIHESGLPYMCPTARIPLLSPRVFMEPCTPCNIGMEKQAECTISNPSVTQWPTTDTNVSVLTVNSTTPGLCYTQSRTNASMYSWSACDSCGWSRERLAIGSVNRPRFRNWCARAIGIQRFACNPLSTANLYTVIPADVQDTTSFCAHMSTKNPIDINGSHFGLGALIECQKDKIIFQRYGYGYFAGDVIEGYPSFVSETQKVIVQPYGATGFNVANQGMQIINMSDYTNILGQAYEANLFSAPARAGTTFYITNIILGIINVLLIVTHIGLSIYEKELKERFALAALETT